MTESYRRLQGSMKHYVTAGGLRICWLPKEGYSKTFAILATRYGSCDQSFSYLGKRYGTPAGVAHFLEHKMFEDKDGNALQKFAKTGASPNAFTSRVMTAYHFSCTERFEENLEILMKFVFSPYFTEENVAKERGIIGQEIGMLDDTPGWQVYTGLFEGMYHEHPSRISIAGSVGSIAEITPETLYTCHAAFYNPANMVLVVCGPADFDSICSIAEANAPDESPEPCIRHYGERHEAVKESLVTRKMHVSQPQFYLGFKDEPPQNGESRMRREFLGDLAARILGGETSSLYAELYDRRLIKRDFDAGYALLPEGAYMVTGGESPDPYAAREAIEREVVRFADEGVDETLFTRVKNSVYGLYLRVLESPESCGRREVSALFGGEHYMDFASLADTVSPADVRQMYVRWAQQGRSSMSVVEPL